MVFIKVSRQKDLTLTKRVPANGILAREGKIIESLEQGLKFELSRNILVSPIG